MPPWRERQSQFNSDAVQLLVVRPQLCTFGQLYCSEQMGVDISDPEAEQRLALDEMKNLCVCRDAGMRKVCQCVQHALALTQSALSKFADDKGVRQNHPRIQ